MAIKEKYDQAVIGSASEDLEETLIQIHRPEINIVSAYMPPSSGTVFYLDHLDIEKRYLKPKTDEQFFGYGYEPGFFYLRNGRMET